MQLTIQTHSGITVAEDIPEGSSVRQVKEIVNGALWAARNASQAWSEWMKENETPAEREMRELNEEMQRRQLEAMKSQLSARGDAEKMLRESL